MACCGLVCFHLIQLKNMTHLVMYSGGGGSWAAAKRVIQKHGLDNTILLFADVLIEDDDLYRFLVESVSEMAGRPRKYHAFHLPDVKTDLPARKVALRRLAKDTTTSFPLLKWISDGRTPWEVFKDVKFVGNSRIDPCSRILKRELLNQWREDNCLASNTVTHFGIDWTEEHRLDAVKTRHAPWICEAPMCEAPYLEKCHMLKLLADVGIQPPRLYKEGFSHNNCGGFCVKSGQAQFALLLKTNKPLYLHHEDQEEGMMDFLGRKDCTIMKDRRGGTTKPLSMRAFRERIETNPSEYDKYDWGGCGCALN